jgi:hypothetical protein
MSGSRITRSNAMAEDEDDVKLLGSDADSDTNITIPAPVVISDFKRKLTMGVLISINLLNYLDRYTVAGQRHHRILSIVVESIYVRFESRLFSP